MKRTAKERAARECSLNNERPLNTEHAELDEALGDLLEITIATSDPDWIPAKQRIRDLFAREHERGWIEAMESRIHPAYIRKDEVREMLIEVQKSHHRYLEGEGVDLSGIAPLCRIGANAILREHGYGGEP